MQYIIQRTKNKVRFLIGKHPVLLPILRVKKKYRNLIVTRQTHIVIEGAPGCGNTFAVYAFRSMQPFPVRIASHTHAPAQVLLAVKYAVPTIVLIRDPLEAISSVLSRMSHLTIQEALEGYIDFYKSIVDVRHSYVLCPFDELITDFHKTVNKVNRRYGTSFVARPLTDERIKRILEVDMKDKNAKPQVSRSTEKERIKKIMVSRYPKLLSSAIAVFYEMLD